MDVVGILISSILFVYEFSANLGHLHPEYLITDIIRHEKNNPLLFLVPLETAGADHTLAR